ncbi:ATP-dependent helicase/deoxyribonuclease subunit B [Sideroxyarcus emersonii]|uniref:ATP-dependent helicase/deoxyribonuclease subunit B n=1 Tax=Sideroxyarcus emersonii TaxID=2764705 RepID=A0AAN1X8W4_9PROT|nr:PD-(D/E)XK nuclease family protein [Sideroxyarcus emersonii]BCK86881.1 ATP-dependent helicase/deoxyribonuclease subunit B [Sideroxyarcus emersonii]
MSVSGPFFDRIAQRILTAHPAPDLRGVTILLPNYHAAQPLAQALMRGAQRPALLLPQMVTLNAWAQSVRLDTPVVADSQRSALLYQQLRKSKWFEQADLWSMTQELLKLFDELTHSLHELPGDAESFAALVQQAYQARQNSTLQLEARLVFELWHAMQAGTESDQARVYQQQLARLAQQADRPLYVLRASDWDALEQRFLDEYAQHAAVTVFDLRVMEAQIGAPLFFAATSLEQEARAAAMQVRRWLAAGKRDIAIVAQDRVVARRMRALLERAEVLVADETGWTFATLSVSTVLDRWLTSLQSDFYHRDLLDLLKSPFIFADLTASERKSAVYQLEQLLRKQGIVAGLEKFIDLAGHETALLQLLVRLRQAAALLEQNRKKTLAGWLLALQASLRVLGIDAGLQQDDAGRQLLLALETWQRELAADAGSYRFSEWRRWLAQQLDTQTYRDSSIDSTVRFTHLAATRWRPFDAVLLLGCDADHLPSAANGGRWFNDAVRAALDLSTRGSHAARQHDDLLGLLALNDCVLVTWQKDKNGEHGLLSPYLQILRDEHQRAHGDDRSEPELLACLAAEDAHRVELSQAAQPAPSVAAEAVPAKVSISAYNSLVACPYQFHARYILRLNELDEVQEAIEKRDYGERVHGILQRFHERYRQVGGHDAAEMEAALRRISEDVFADLLQQDFAARAWLARWYRSLPAYLAWQAENEAQGWRYAEAESAFSIELDGVQLRGRIDRLDVREQAIRVLDYKTQGDQILRHKLREPGEDVQLACYAYAHETDDASFVSIEGGKVKTVAPAHDVAQLAQLNAERLVQVMQRMRGGACLPANGIDQACMHCEMRGVCRKGEWL